MKLKKCILLSERSQAEKATYCMSPTILYSGKGKTMGALKQLVVARSLEVRQRGMNSGREGRFGDLGGPHTVILSWKFMTYIPEH